MNGDYPKTLDEAATRAIAALNTEARLELMSPTCDFLFEHFQLGLWIRNAFGLHAENRELTQDICADPYPRDADFYSRKIIDRMRELLRER